MLGNLFKTKPVLEEETIQWLFDGFAWTLENFGSDVFYAETDLIEPSKKFFPGGDEDIDGMAKLIFDKVRHYSGLDHWPCQLIDHHEFEQTPTADAQQALQSLNETTTTPLTLLYDPQQVGSPNVMIANYAQALAHHLGTLAPQPAPCDQEQWPHMMELLAVSMGFGLMFVDTAVPPRRTCGSCGSPAMDRVGALTEMQVCYALAIFCELKQIPAKQVYPHIKNYLKPSYTKATKDVAQRTEQLARLKAINTPSQLRGKAVTQRFIPPL